MAQNLHELESPQIFWKPQRKRPTKNLVIAYDFSYVRSSVETEPQMLTTTIYGSRLVVNSLGPSCITCIKSAWHIR